MRLLSWTYGRYESSEVKCCAECVVLSCAVLLGFVQYSGAEVTLSLCWGVA